MLYVARRRWIVCIDAVDGLMLVEVLVEAGSELFNSYLNSKIKSS